MRPFCIFSYRISANILTHRVSLSHLDASEPVIFPIPLCHLTSLHDNFSPTYPSGHLSALLSFHFSSCSLWWLSWLLFVFLHHHGCDVSSCSALVCWQSLYSTQKVSHFIFEPDLCLDPYFLDACSIFPFMSWAITSQSTCPDWACHPLSLTHKVLKAVSVSSPLSALESFDWTGTAPSSVILHV